MRRTVRQIVLRQETCNGNRETFRNTFLTSDSIVRWHFRSFKRKQTRMRDWHADPAMPEVVLLRSPAEVKRWFGTLSGAGDRDEPGARRA